MTWIRHESPHPAEPDREGDMAGRPLPAEKTHREPPPPLPEGLVARAVATLDPSYFALVMGSGIVSIGASLLGYQVLSQVIFGITAAAFVVLAVVYASRAVWFSSRFRDSLRDPTTAIAYFTVVAGTDVLGSRFLIAGHPLVTLGLGAASFLIWLVLTYGLPWSIVAAAHRPLLGQINGAWLIWVVGTQSLSIVAAGLAPVAPGSGLRDNLPAVAVCLWGVGVMLYVILIVIIFMRLLLVEITPAEMAPAYWIAMGATAISVHAAAGILVLHGPNARTLVSGLRPFLVGLSVVLWSFGTWWIPLLVAFGVWRYVIRRYSWSYEPRLWAVVFPLGMYTVASYSFGRAAGLGFMVTIARGWVFVDVAAWAAVLALMLGAGARAVVRQRRRD